MAKISEAFTGSVHGRLTVLSVFKKLSGGKLRAFANCECSCGTLLAVYVGSLGPHTSSCGCLHRQLLTDRNTTHNLCGTRTYVSWYGMWQRCTNPKVPGYRIYKDRTPPDYWRKFENFYADMGECPPDLSIERLDNDKPYSKENCVWASRREQNRNQSRNIRVILDGNSICLKDAAELVGVKYTTVYQRIFKRGWTLTQALENPNYSWPGGC